VAGGYKSASVLSTASSHRLVVRLDGVPEANASIETLFHDVDELVLADEFETYILYWMSSIGVGDVGCLVFRRSPCGLTATIADDWIIARAGTWTPP
jgi:hypothetical protein